MFKSQISKNFFRNFRNFCTKSDVKKEYKIDVLSTFNFCACAYIYYKCENNKNEMKDKIYYMSKEIVTKRNEIELLKTEIELLKNEIEHNKSKSNVIINELELTKDTVKLLVERDLDQQNHNFWLWWVHFMYFFSSSSSIIIRN